MAVSLRQLELFRLVLQTQNVTETARLRRISQPSVSQSLQALEQSLQLKLFIRHRGRISPTPEARALLRDVERLFIQAAAIDNRAAELRDAHVGNLAIASLPTLSGSILPPAVTLMRRDRPRVRITMNGYLDAELLRQVRDEGMDIGFLYAPVDEPEIVCEPILKSRLICLLPPAHPLAQSPSIGLSQLVGETVIMHPTIPPRIRMHKQIIAMGTKVEATLEANQSFGAVSLVRHGVGIYITEPLILASELTRDLVARPFEPSVPQDLAMVYSRRRPIPQLVMRFVRHLRTVLHETAIQIRERGIDINVL